MDNYNIVPMRRYNLFYDNLYDVSSRMHTGNV